MIIIMIIIIIIIIIISILLNVCRSTTGRPRKVLRPIFRLRIYNVGIRAKQILKRRRWIFLVHRRISQRSDFGFFDSTILGLTILSMSNGRTLCCYACSFPGADARTDLERSSAQSRGLAAAPKESMQVGDIINLFLFSGILVLGTFRYFSRGRFRIKQPLNVHCSSWETEFGKSAEKYRERGCLKTRTKNVSWQGNVKHLSHSLSLSIYIYIYIYTYTVHTPTYTYTY